MAGMSSSISGMFGGFSALLTLGTYLFIFLLIGAALFGIVFFVLIRKSETKIIEIDINNKKIKSYAGRIRRNKHKIKQFWVGKLKKFLPNLQQRDIYSTKKQDAVILVKDNNGLFHTARIPSYKQIKKWYQVVYNIDLEKFKQTKELEEQGITENYIDKLRHIYLLPSPHEDLDWLANVCAESEKEYNSEHWWQHPNVAIIGTGMVCAIMFIMTLILLR